MGNGELVNLQNYHSQKRKSNPLTMKTRISIAIIILTNIYGHTQTLIPKIGISWSALGEERESKNRVFQFTLGVPITIK